MSRQRGRRPPCGHTSSQGVVDFAPLTQGEFAARSSLRQQAVWVLGGAGVRSECVWRERWRARFAINAVEVRRNRCRLEKSVELPGPARHLLHSKAFDHSLKHFGGGGWGLRAHCRVRAFHAQQGHDILSEGRRRPPPGCYLCVPCAELCDEPFFARTLDYILLKLCLMGCCQCSL